MRVIAGYLGGQIFDSPHGHRTHPMSEKMRGALFGSLGDITGLSVFDPFSGSGAIAIEAVSRGAARVVAIEVDPAAHSVIKKNIEKFDLGDKIQATKAYAGAWSTRHQDEKFDVIILDPPYDNLPFRDLKRMPRHLAENGVLVLSWPAKADYLHFDGLKYLQTKPHGDGNLHYYTHA